MTSSCFSGENNVVYFFLFSTLESWAVWAQDVHLASYGKYLILENTCKIQSFVHMLILCPSVPEAHWALYSSIRSLNCL